MPPEPRFPATLLLFGVLSFLAHAATFFLFQVGYPSHVSIPLQTPQVSLLTGETPEQQAIMRWVESEDPALVAATSHPVPAGLFEIPYRPSYQTPRTAPRSMAEVKEAPERAPAPALSTLLRSVLPAAPGAAPKVERAPTKILLSAGLARRALLAPPVLKTAVAGPLEDASVMLGVTPEGEVRFVLLQRSSGDHATDAAALAQLEKARLGPVESAPDIEWGFADIVWGDDAYPTPPK
jgi:outer membrane biosynthesis protein TonB